MGKVFLNMAAYLKCYTPYIYNLRFSQQLVSDLTAKNSKFNKFVTEAAKDPKCRGLIMLKILF
jgi:hypothetical protein